MDKRCYEVLCSMRLPFMRLVPLWELEAADPELLKKKKSRSKVEYYFTCSPAFPLYLLETHAELEEITYLDADLYFLDSPSIVYDEIDDSSIAIIPHRFSRKLRHKEKYGIYNVSLVYFRRDENGLACLRWWRRRCLEWCHAWVEKDRFADQKYLDRWPGLFDGVRVLQNKGLNLAAWNMADFSISSDRAGSIRVDRQPLVFFHFQGLRRIRSWLYDPYTLNSKLRLRGYVKKQIFLPYIQTLIRMHNRAVSHGLEERAPENLRHLGAGLPPGRRIKHLLKGCLYIAISIITRNYVVIKPDRP